jgi:hypothetical protein
VPMCGVHVEGVPMYGVCGTRDGCAYVWCDSVGVVCVPVCGVCICVGCVLCVLCVLCVSRVQSVVSGACMSGACMRGAWV